MTFHTLRLAQAGALALSIGFSATLAVAQTPPPAVPVQITQDPAQVKAGRYEVEPHHTRIIWKVSHHGFSTFQATMPDISGSLDIDPAKPESAKVDITIDMTKASSGIPVFDEHMARPHIFNTAQFKSATFRSTKVVRTGTKTAKVTGDLTFLGVTKPITLDVVFNLAGTGRAPPPQQYRIGFDATAVLKRSQWGSTAMPTIGDDVTLEIEAEFVQPLAK